MRKTMQLMAVLGSLVLAAASPATAAEDGPPFMALPSAALDSGNDLTEDMSLTPLPAYEPGMQDGPAARMWST